MSSHTHSAAPANTHTAVSSRTHRQTGKRTRDDDDDEEKQPAQSSTHVSPAMRLYRHALESIFAMLTLQDLNHALAVSRSWSAAVRSMKPICATVLGEYWCTGNERPPPPPFARLLTSPLIRHLAAITFNSFPEHHFSEKLTSESLALLAQHAPSLTSLNCRLLLSGRAPWTLPAKLVSLELQLLGPFTAVGVNSLLTSVSALSALTSLSVVLPKGSSAIGVDFSLLAASPSLTELTFRDEYWQHPRLGHEQVHQIHATLGHLQRIDVARMDAVTLARFLQPPVTARWQDIGTVLPEAATGALLLTLPSLTKLNASFRTNRPHADFLSQLPQLKTLELWSKRRDEDVWHDDDEEEDDAAFFVPPAAMLNSLLPCTGLTELTTDCGFCSAQLTDLFSKLTSLTRLSIYGGLESLECFSSGPITQTLQELNLLEELRLPPSEIVHLFALRRLRCLNLDRCWSKPPDDAAIDSLSPPTPILPLLTEFICNWWTGVNEWRTEERKGPSFEWTQARLTQ